MAGVAGGGSCKIGDDGEGSSSEARVVRMAKVAWLLRDTRLMRLS